MDFMTEHAPQLMITAGLLLLVVEVAFLGFATFILFFVGLSLVITGLLAWAGVMPAEWSVILLANALLTLLLAGVLWRPLLRLQGEAQTTPAKSDFDGYRFFLEAEVNRAGHAKHRYSGIEWSVKSEQTLAAGIEVEVFKADVGVLWVKRVE